jgi:hypothetical protein
MQPIPLSAAVIKVHDISVGRVKYFVVQSSEGGADPLG